MPGKSTFYCETPILKAQRSGMGKLNNPAQRRVNEIQSLETKCTKDRRSNYPAKQGYNTPQRARRIASKACFGVHTRDYLMATGYNFIKGRLYFDCIIFG
jgi:hypothetical protein